MWYVFYIFLLHRHCPFRVIAANIHIFSIKPKASGVIILCPPGKICVVRHVVVVIRSLNILIMNKELNLLIHAKTTKHSLSFASHSAYCRHAEILLRVIKESTTSVLSLVWMLNCNGRRMTGNGDCALMVAISSTTYTTPTPCRATKTTVWRLTTTGHLSLLQLSISLVATRRRQWRKWISHVWDTKNKIISLLNTL